MAGLQNPPSVKLTSLEGYKTAQKRGRITSTSQPQKGLRGALGRLSEFYEKISDKIGELQAVSGFTVTGFMQNMVQGAAFIYQFDFNISDKEIQNQIDNSLKQLAVLTAGSFGQSVGWALCGGVAGQLITKFDSALALQLARKAKLSKLDSGRSLSGDINSELDEEMLDELAGTYANLFQQARKTSQKVQFLWLFREARNLLKVSGLSERVFGKEFTEKWGKEDGPALSLKEGVENLIKKIPNETIQEMVEEFLDEALDACNEALMVIGSAADGWLAYQRSIQNQSTFGEVVTIEIKPHPDRNEVIKLTGQEELIKPAISQAIASYQLIENRDVGDVIAMPLQDHARRSFRELEIILEYSTYEGGVTSINGKRPRHTPTYQIPIERSKLDWNTIKTAAGGNNGYTYGPCHVTWTLETPSGEFGGALKVYAASEAEAEERLRAFLALSDYKLVSPGSGEEKEGGRRSRASGNVKERVRVFPTYFTIQYKKKTQRLDRGRQQLNVKDRVATRKSKIELWPSTKPDGVEEEIQAFLSLPD